jgi:hypothetical protein
MTHKAQSFAEPEDAKGDVDDAYTKLERVFRYLSEWTMDYAVVRTDGRVWSAETRFIGNCPGTARRDFR